VNVHANKDKGLKDKQVGSFAHTVISRIVKTGPSLCDGRSGAPFTKCAGNQHSYSSLSMLRAGHQMDVPLFDPNQN
jgi:hypothetical protein